MCNMGGPDSAHPPIRPTFSILNAHFHTPSIKSKLNIKVTQRNTYIQLYPNFHIKILWKLENAIYIFRRIIKVRKAKILRFPKNLYYNLNIYYFLNIFLIKLNIIFLFLKY